MPIHDPNTNAPDRILTLLIESPGQLARDLAATMGVDKRDINSILYGPLRGKVRQDSSYRWHSIEATPATNANNSPIVVNTPLSKLCRYYLDCLSNDDTDGLSVFASSQFGLDYVELTNHPLVNVLSPEDLFANSEAQRLLGKIRNDRGRLTLVIGYPVRLNKIRSKKGWEGFTVEPVLLHTLQDNPDNPRGTPKFSDDLPQINFKLLKGFSMGDAGGLMEEAVQIAQELGLDCSPGATPDVDELAPRLRSIRADWDWKEEPDPYSLSKGLPLSEISEPGIYNRAVLLVAERSPFTKGLESELHKLQTIGNEVNNSALGTWIQGNINPSTLLNQDVLIEVLPLNNEQRQAVQQGLSNPLTVITGPPGTGKSQVVTSLLINAAWRGKKVLFASKNNKAVDVVEQRVNGLGPRPVLLRMGANQHQTQLAEYLTSLLAATATEHDQMEHDESLKQHSVLRSQTNSLQSTLDTTVAIRNNVDRREQDIEKIRTSLKEPIFSNLRRFSCVDGRSEYDRFKKSIDSANKAKLGFLAKFFWSFIRDGRFSELREEHRKFASRAESLGISLPSGDPSDSNIESWLAASQLTLNRIGEATAVRGYFDELEFLRSSESLESANRKLLTVTDELSNNSRRLWETWLRLLPRRLTSVHRKLLGEYCSLLNLVIAANDGGHAGRGVFRRYYELFPQITAILPCWAVTSLSAHGRVPMEAGFFDLLVVDEASQCDIASAIPLLYRAKQVVVIGDPKQLRHISSLSTQKDRQLLEKHDLIENAVNWNFGTNSLFDLASRLCRSDDIISLRDHHRSHADIIEFSNEQFYEGRLRVATNHKALKIPSPDKPAIRWVNVVGEVVRPGTGGAANEKEAQTLVAELRRLLVEQSYKGSIGVVSPFRAQANLIRELVSRDNDLSSLAGKCDLLIDTVHRFQGDERDVMLFSPVISSNATRGSIGFLQGNPHIFNVAITRARAALIVVGDQAMAQQGDVKYLMKFSQYALEHGIRRRSSMPLDGDHGPRYPKVSKPERVSEWEHLLYEALYIKGIRTIPQYDIDKYTLDLALVDGQRRLDIEVDGERYHRNWDGELCRRDQIRNHRLIELGWDVMRFWVYQIRDDLPWCIERVQEWISSKSRSQFEANLSP